MGTSGTKQTDKTVIYEKQDQVVLMTLNRPEALNSINRDLLRELSEAILRFDADENARVAIITGAGRAFCAGRDLKERAADNAAGKPVSAWDSMTSENPYMWPRTWKPLIAAVNGYALAGGWSIAQMCDLRLAAEDARLGITESHVGLLAPFASILPKLIPMAAVLEMVLTAEPVTAQRAYDFGFVNKVVPGDQLMEEAMSLAKKVAGNAPIANQYFKEMAYRGLDMTIPGISALSFQMYERLLQTDDAKEGPRAFAEKRAPQWKGR